MDVKPSAMHRILAAIRAHPRIFWVAVTVLLASVVFVLVWFQPQKIFIEETVNEPLPAAVEDDEGDGEEAEPASTPEEAAEPMVLASGRFQRLEHPTMGTATIVELEDGRRFLRFEDLDTSNGPDLRVYLSEIAASDDWYAYGERFVDLGALKGNRGDQNYVLPDDLDLSRFKSAVIWCRRFTVGFGVAGLEQA
jgi:hypothetical protein